MGVGGCAARDVALHFVQRWNHDRGQALAASAGVQAGKA